MSHQFIKLIIMISIYLSKFIKLLINLAIFIFIIAKLFNSILIKDLYASNAFNDFNYYIDYINSNNINHAFHCLNNAQDQLKQFYFVKQKTNHSCKVNYNSFVKEIYNFNNASLEFTTNAILSNNLFTSFFVSQWRYLLSFAALTTSVFFTARLLNETFNNYQLVNLANNDHSSSYFSQNLLNVVNISKINEDRLDENYHNYDDKKPNNQTQDYINNHNKNDSYPVLAQKDHDSDYWLNYVVSDQDAFLDLAQKFHIHRIDYPFFKEIIFQFYDFLPSDLERQIFIDDILVIKDYFPSKKPLYNYNSDVVYELNMKWDLALSKAYKKFDSPDQIINSQKNTLDYLNSLYYDDSIIILDELFNTAYPNDYDLFDYMMDFLANEINSQKLKSLFLMIVFLMPRVSVQNIQFLAAMDISQVLHEIDKLVKKFADLYRLDNSSQIFNYRKIFANYYQTNVKTDHQNNDLALKKEIIKDNKSYQVNDNYYDNYNDKLTKKNIDANKIYNEKNQAPSGVLSLNSLQDELFNASTLTVNFIAHRQKIYHKHHGLFKSLAIEYYKWSCKTEVEKFVFIKLVLDIEHKSFQIRSNYGSYIDKILHEIGDNSDMNYDELINLYHSIKSDFELFIVNNSDQVRLISWHNDNKVYYTMDDLLKASISAFSNIQFSYNILSKFTSARSILNYYYNPELLSNILNKFVLRVIKNPEHRLIFLNQLLNIYYFDDFLLSDIISRNGKSYDIDKIYQISDNLVKKFENYLYKLMI